jgi:MSHA pilin protein MshD
MSVRPTIRQSGLTLIELIVFIIVVSVGLAGVLSVLNLTVARSADPLLYKQALAAADAMLEEILLKDFADPGGPAEAGRATWDNVDDYNGYASTGVFSPADIATPVLSGYNVAVQVAQPAAAILGVAPSDIRRVTVSVSFSGGGVSLTGYRFNYDAP